MQFETFDVLRSLFATESRVSKIEERQEWALEKITTQGDRLGKIERRIDHITTAVGIMMLALLVLINLPPEISGKVITVLKDLLPSSL